MKLENFSDLFKYNKTLLEDDFNAGQALVIKTTSKATDNVTEISSTYKQSAVADKGEYGTTFEAKFKSVTGETAHEGVIKQDGSASYEIKTSLDVSALMSNFAKEMGKH